MVATGGGADLPSKERKEVNGSKQKELVLCALPWPQEGAQRAIKALKDTFDDVDVEYFQRTDNTEIPAGTYGMESQICRTKLSEVLVAGVSTVIVGRLAGRSHHATCDDMRS